MNFLSHFYFDRNNINSFIVLGTVLPDLIKNANKNWNLYPQKSEDLFDNDEQQNSILIGWKRHLQVDLLFHSSDFFNQQTAQLKKLLVPILQDSPVRPSFLAHIGVELLLDHLLVTHNKIDIAKFYDHLTQANNSQLFNFLKKCDIDDSTIFFNFYNSFISSRYLLSYQKLENISYALQRICLRLWPYTFSEATLNHLTVQLEIYKAELEVDFMLIFDQIEAQLNNA